MSHNITFTLEKTFNVRSSIVSYKLNPRLQANTEEQQHFSLTQSLHV